MVFRVCNSIKSYNAYWYNNVSYDMIVTVMSKVYLIQAGLYYYISELLTVYTTIEKITGFLKRTKIRVTIKLIKQIT